MDLNLGEWLGIAAVVMAVIAVPSGVLATRRFGNRRRQVWFVYDSRSLLPDLPEGTENPLKITFRDVPVEKPHLVTVGLTNVGPVDIASSHFDSGRDIEVTLGCPTYGVVSNTHPANTTCTPAGSDGVLRLSPLLLKRREAWVVEVVVSGTAQPRLTSPLIDTDVLDERAHDPVLVRKTVEKAGQKAMLDYFHRQG